MPDKPALTPRDAAGRLRLLYSWEAALTQSGSAPSEARSRKVIQREARRLRRSVQAHLERLGKDLQRVFAADQARPGNLVIEEKLARLRHEIRQFNHVLKATGADDLGGMVELPLDHYPVELGLGRDAVLRLDRDDFITLAAAAAIIIVACLSITWYSLWREDVTFSMERPSPGQVAIHFRNDSSFVASLYGPWPESEAGLEKRSYGMRLLCRTSGMDEFQDCTNIREAWGYQGQVIAPQKPVQVDTGVAVTVVLHVSVLEKAYGDPVEAIRIECGNRKNRDDVTFDIVLNE